ncbi:VOC family protein [Streptomyces sp. NPDC026672]|uniref:VOC family protein n=1 Tax=unclassified Streptomyces TaxID=2593676 RepID=UPI003410AD09
MTVEFNHTVVFAKDEEASARWLADILGLPEPASFGPFKAVEMGAVHLDYVAFDGEFPTQHFSFLVSENSFDEIFARIKERGMTYWGDPFRRHPWEINTGDGGRSIYFDDPNGHDLEIQTTPYVFIPGALIRGRDDQGRRLEE